MNNNQKLIIHQALWSNANHIDIDGQIYNIKTNHNHCRFVTTSDGTYIQQNSKHLNDKSSLRTEYAQGKKITRILRPGKSWGLIIDNKVKKP